MGQKDNEQNAGISERINYPKLMYLQLTESCSLRCNMCYQWGKNGALKPEKNIKHLELDAARKVIADLSIGKPIYRISGGEPLEYPWISEVLSAIKDCGCNADITTNGVLIEDHYEMIVKYLSGKLWISLDGPEKINDIQRGEGVFNKVMKGIDLLFEERKSKLSKSPQIGISFLITPLNYSNIEEFFLKSIDISKIDAVSIEFQLFLDEEQCREYEKLLSAEFGLCGKQCKFAGGLIRDRSEFECIDVKELVRQLNAVKDFCSENNVEFFVLPKTIDEKNYKAYFTGNKNDMADKRRKCAFPWASAEISARGEVAPCYTFYDLTLGSIYKYGILDIWNGPEYKKFRGLLKTELLPVCTACIKYFYP